MPTPTGTISRALAAAVAVIGLCQPAAAQPADTFYAGKTVRVLIGFDVGGQYGQFARLAATHLRQHIPGHPALTVQAMPGASGMTAMNYLVGPGPQDGTAIALVTLGVMQDGLLEPGSKFDPTKLSWIGRMQSVVQLGIAATATGLKTLADAKAREFVAGGTGINSLPTMNFRLLNEMAGTRFRIVAGYKGTAEMHIAMERGEITAYNNAWDVIQERYLADVKSGRFTLIFNNGLSRIPELASVPYLADFARNDVEKAFMKIYASGTELGRSLVAPAAIPKERLALLRTAFSAMLTDPAFLADTKQQGIRLEPMSGQQVEAMANDVLGVPRETVAAARAFYARLLADAK